MKNKPDVAKLKQAQHDQWVSAAPGYAKWVVERHMLGGLYEKFASFLQQALGAEAAVQVLDVASASGEPAVTVSKALPQASVISTDLAEGYRELGQHHAAAEGVAGRVSFQTADAEDLRQFADSTFDAVTCSLGLMFMPQHEKALAECYRVLKPGGVLAFSVWQTIEKWPFLKTVMDFCAEMDPEALANTPPGMATRFGEPSAFAGLLAAVEGVGFKEVSAEVVNCSFHLAPHLWWDAMLEMPFPLSKILAARKEKGDARAYEDAHQRLRQVFIAKGFRKEDGTFHVEGNMCNFVTARK